MSWSFGVLLLLAYLLGSIPTGVVLARAFSHLDIRAHGSGNIGATNVTRVLGVRLGAITLLGDALKGFVPTVLAAEYLDAPTAPGWVALAAFFGHCYSIFLKLQGGKGVAVALGNFLALTPKVLPLTLLVWGVVFYKSRKSSLASLLAAPVALMLAWNIEAYRSAVPFIVAMIGVIFWRHRSNIQRLRQGREL